MPRRNECHSAPCENVITARISHDLRRNEILSLGHMAGGMEPSHRGSRSRIVGHWSFQSLLDIEKSAPIVQGETASVIEQSLNLSTKNILHYGLWIAIPSKHEI
jgi:hypothetical protein